VIFNYSILLFFFIWLVSCTTKTNEKVKDLGDIIPKSSNKTPITDKVSKSTDTILNGYFTDFKNWEIDSVNEVEYNFIPDRFNPITSKKMIAYSSKDSTHLLVWNYKDSVETKRAFFNFLDCIEKPCRSVQLLERKKVSSNNILIFKNEKSLILVKSSSTLVLADWLSFFYIKKISSDFDIIVEQVKNGKTNWYSSTKEKYKPLTK
jgi:hypothetical protein